MSDAQIDNVTMPDANSKNLDETNTVETASFTVENTNTSMNNDEAEDKIPSPAASEISSPVMSPIQSSPSTPIISPNPTDQNEMTDHSFNMPCTPEVTGECIKIKNNFS